MLDFIFKSIIWILAIYGLIEIVKTIIYTYTYTSLKPNGIYIIVAVKNQANKIEGFVRTTLFRMIYGKEENIKNIIAVDLNSTDETKQILEKLSNEYENIKVSNWKEWKEIFDSIDEVKEKD